MKTITLDALNQKFNLILDKVTVNKEKYIISSNGSKTILMSKEEYDELMKYVANK